MPESEHFLEKFVSPRSVAVVGASNNPARINYHLVGNLINMGYPGRIYPVNPREREIGGIKSFPSVSDLEEVVDLAVIGVSSAHTPKVLEECARKGIKRVILIAGGFSEIGPKGRETQNHMAELLKKYNMRAIGPNALSPINVRGKFAVSFHELKTITPGNLSLIFQSGLYEPAFTWLLTDYNLRFSKLIDLGNKMDIHEVDALNYLLSDPETRVIGIHTESISGDGREFYRALCKARECRKRVVVLKTGRTTEGARAAASHTGSMVRGSDLVFDAVLRQSGALRVDTVEAFFDISRAMDRFGAILPKGNRVAVGVFPGGLGVMVTDLCERSGLRMAAVSKASLELLQNIYPPWPVAPNPWDLGVTTQFNNPITVFDTWMNAMAGDPNVDMLVFQLHEGMLLLGEDFFRMFLRAKDAGKPTAIWIQGKNPGTSEMLKWLEENNVPVFPSPEKAIQALVALCQLNPPWKS